MKQDTQEYELMLAPGVAPQEAASALANTPDEAQLRAIMNRLDPADAARLVAYAPDIAAQTRLIWSLEKRQRAAVVDHLAPVTVAAMIQNQERRNRKLLGDVSLEHFGQILEFCSPKQQYYWISLANSFADVGANLLVVLLPPQVVAEALLTVPEFRRKRYALRRYLPGGFERFPPVEDRRLRAILTRLAEYDSDRYHEVVEIACQMAEDARVHADTYAEIEKEPILLPRIPQVPPLPLERTAVGEGDENETSAAAPLLPVPLPSASDSLVRVAVGLLPSKRRAALESELEKLFRDEVVAQGGSLAMPDLERAAARLQAMLRLGLRGVPDEPDQIAAILNRVRARDIVQRGTAALEQLRQIALRLRPFAAVMDRRQRDLLLALVHPDPTIDPGTGEAALRVPALDRRRRADTVPVAAMHERLADLSVWVAIARALGVRSLTPHLAEAPEGSLAILAALSISLANHQQWDAGTLQSATLKEFRHAHFDRKRGTWKAGVAEQTRQAVRNWVAQSGIDPSLQARAVVLVMDAFARLEVFFRTRRILSWERFAPPKRHRKAPETGHDEETEGMD